MAQITHVTQYNHIMQLAGHYTMVMTTGNGSMLGKPRVKGWVVYGNNFAKWFKNKHEAGLELEARA